MRSTSPVNMRCVPQTIQALEHRFGALTPLGGGYSSRVYMAGHRVLKVYHAHNGLHELEAANMRRAGLGHWVLETLELAPSALPDASRLEPADVLVMRRFTGHPVTAADIPKALPELGAFLRQLHANRAGNVNLEALSAKLERFDLALSPLPARRDLEPLFDCVRSALQTGALGVPASLCHLDLWHQNVLFQAPDQVLVVDWHKSAFDDAVRDYALFFSGTLELLALTDALRLILELTDAEGVTARLAPYVALTTLHDLYWFHVKRPGEFAPALELKLPRALALIASS